MQRRHFIQALGALGAGSWLSPARAGDKRLGTLQRPASHWRPYLDAAQFDILFNEATEPPFSHPLDKEKRAGTYLCAACLNPLFDAAEKYDSRTGWPSFRDELSGALGTRTDYKLLYPRKEYHCARCGGHQGHVFKDGPPPDGLRYCNNGLALQFVPAGESLPELRT